MFLLVIVFISQMFTVYTCFTEKTHPFFFLLHIGFETKINDKSLYT